MWLAIRGFECIINEFRRILIESSKCATYSRTLCIKFNTCIACVSMHVWMAQSMNDFDGSYYIHMCVCIFVSTPSIRLDAQYSQCIYVLLNGVFIAICHQSKMCIVPSRLSFRSDPKLNTKSSTPLVLSPILHDTSLHCKCSLQLLNDIRLVTFA